GMNREGRIPRHCRMAREPLKHTTGNAQRLTRRVRKSPPAASTGLGKSPSGVGRRAVEHNPAMGSAAEPCSALQAGCPRYRRRIGSLLARAAPGGMRTDSRLDTALRALSTGSRGPTMRAEEPIMPAPDQYSVLKLSPADNFGAVEAAYRDYTRM